jgi:hypothetical protein
VTVTERGILMTWLIVFFAVVVALVGVASLAIGGWHNIEARLRHRAERHDGLLISELTSDAHERYAEQWQEVQGRFVDDPRQTLAEAAELVTRVLNERGYPVDDYDDYSDHVSVDFPALADGYAMAQAVRIGIETATIDDQRQAIQNYRSLFDELLTSRALSADDAAASGADRAEHNVS